jgi:hypothetical protein
MARYTRVIGHYDAETQAYSACAGTFQTSPFTPDVGGRLIGIRVLEGQEAATSLTCDIQIRLSCAIWKPNTMDVAINGSGLMTAPIAHLSDVTFTVDQPVQAGVPITVEGRNNTATGVTVSVLVIGIFEA